MVLPPDHEKMTDGELAAALADLGYEHTEELVELIRRPEPGAPPLP